MNPQERACLLRNKVLLTWDPPRKSGNETAAQIAQTAVIQSLAFIFGKEFLWELTENQTLAIDQGLEVMNRELMGHKPVS